MKRAARASILVVDDTPANLLALEVLLRPLGHEIVSASSGLAALELSAEREFAVILLDVMMPVLDGIATLERLRALQRAANTPVILLTAYQPERATMERAYALGALDFVEKPVSVEILRAKVSSYVALYQQAQEIRRQADALRAKDRHLGVLAHDLRNPLAVILSGAHRLAHADAEEVRRMAERVARAALRMERLVDDLLQFARAAEERIVVQPERMELCALCREVLEDVETLFPHVEFRCELPAELSGTWDRARLEQVVANLLTNAAKYGTGWVSAAVAQREHWAELTVTNGGEVIPEARLEQLFAPFVRGGTSRAGVGLGLHIARDMARAHGGDVIAASDAESTRFILRLPLAVDSTASARAHA